MVCSFVGRLFRHALEESRPKSVLINSLSICISLLDPKRLTLGTYHMFGRQMIHGSTVAANPETVEGMLESLGKSASFLGFSLSNYSFCFQDSFYEEHCHFEPYGQYPCRWFAQALRCFICGQHLVNYIWQVTAPSWKTSFKGTLLMGFSSI